MTPENYNNRFTSVLQYMMGLTNRKRQDYAGDVDVFKNFELIEIITSGRVSTAAGILVRLTDKLQRVANLLARPNAVADEKIEDTLLDNAIYSIIMYLWLTRDKAELSFPDHTITARAFVKSDSAELVKPEPAFVRRNAIPGSPDPLPEGYSELPEGVSPATLDETYQGLLKRVEAGGARALSPTERTWLEMLIKMKLGITETESKA